MAKPRKPKHHTSNIKQLETCCLQVPSDTPLEFRWISRNPSKDHEESDKNHRARAKPRGAARPTIPSRWSAGAPMISWASIGLSATPGARGLVTPVAVRPGAHRASSAGPMFWTSMQKGDEALKDTESDHRSHVKIVCFLVHDSQVAFSSLHWMKSFASQASTGVSRATSASRVGR